MTGSLNKIDRWPARELSEGAWLKPWLGGILFDQGGEPILQDRNKRHEHRKYSAGSFKFKHPEESAPFWTTAPGF